MNNQAGKLISSRYRVERSFGDTNLRHVAIKEDRNFTTICFKTTHTARWVHTLKKSLTILVQHERNIEASNELCPEHDR
ncbi:hypothetical protein AFLA_005279 [Aspergillus flavus NRRL3357]|nr:hypothetical protein AFLA_005279 [Aspergillus flavus NRRL3357]